MGTLSRRRHLHFARGGEADFRGRDGVYYNFFSAPGFTVNVKTEESYTTVQATAASLP